LTGPARIAISIGKVAAVVGAVLVAVWLLSILVVALLSALSGGPGIVDRIRAAASPLLDHAEYSFSPTGTGYIRAYLVATASVADGRAFWCDVIVPAAGPDLGRLSISVWSGDPPGAGIGAILASDGEPCP
jgi:hypothetical protein